MFLYSDETSTFQFSAFYVNYCGCYRQKQVLTLLVSTLKNELFSKNVNCMFLYSDETYIFQFSAIYVNNCGCSLRKQVLPLWGTTPEKGQKKLIVKLTIFEFKLSIALPKW